MSTRAAVAPTPLIPDHPAQPNEAVNDHHADWLYDPMDALTRAPGPYTSWNASQYLEEEPVELYNGWLVWQEMTNIRERTILGTIQDMLSLSACQANFGQALPDQAECKLDDKNVIKPDACLISWRHLREDAQPDGPNERILLMKCPELVIESRSPSNRRRQEALKRQQYFANGTEVIWDVDEENEVIYVYRAENPQKPVRYGVADEIDCLPFLPNWRRRVADTFADNVSAEVVAGEVAEEWRNEGVEIGEARGIEIGEARGQETERQKMIQAMLADGLDPATVARIANLPVAQVAQIAAAE